MATTLVPRSHLFRSVFGISRNSYALCTRSQETVTSTIFETSNRSFTTVRSTRHQTPVTPSLICSRAVQRRNASAAPVSPATSMKSSSTAQSPTILTWDRFLAMRGRRRFVNLGFAIAGAATAAVFGSPLIGALDIDTTVAQMTGMDPLIVIAAGSIAVAAVGWFAGRVVGSMAFSMWARQKGWHQMIAEKEKSLLHRIKRYRADPTSSSPQNPIPDYYGEKIKSVQGYRKWLKDQRTYTKKMYRDVR